MSQFALLAKKKVGHGGGAIELTLAKEFAATQVDGGASVQVLRWEARDSPEERRGRAEAFVSRHGLGQASVGEAEG